MTNITAADVRDDPENSRLVVELDGHIAELVYREEPDRLVLVHTGVPDELEGHGIGGTLVRAGVERARAEGRTLAPWCPFARRWLEDHPDVASTVSIDWTPRPDH